MYHHDFLLRQLERLAKAIQQIWDSYESGKVDDAYELLDKCYKESGFLRSQLQDWEPEAFLDNLEKEGLGAQELEALSKLTEIEGQLYAEEEEQEEARHRYELTFMLLKKASEKDTANFSLDRQTRINTIYRKLNSLS